jgi:hypothetical protein
MAFHFAFVYLSTDADPSSHRGVVETESTKCTVVAVRDYAQAEKIANELVAEGVEAIELCGGFGYSGTARVAAAVAGKAYVGSIRFDGHPAMECKSGDALFG